MDIPELDALAANIKQNDISDPVELFGIIPKHRVNINDLRPYFDTIAQGARQKNIQQRHQSITLPDGPVGIAPFSDQHWGGKVDYPSLIRDTQIVADTKNFFAIHDGDLTDNYIIGKLQSIQRQQSTTFQQELRGALWWVDTISPSLIAWCSGNHDNWTLKTSGIDFWRTRLQDTLCLYDPNQIVFNINHHGHTWRVCLRHKWKGHSIFNCTHGIEVGWERVTSFDIGIGGHTHIGTVCRPFFRDGKRRYAVLLGTYKDRDEYARECGYPDTAHDSRGSGAFVFLPDGRLQWFDDIPTAADFLKHQQTQYKRATNAKAKKKKTRRK